MKEISIAQFVDELDSFRESGMNYDVKFLSPTKKLLSLNSDSIYKENPDFYVIVDFVKAKEGKSITLNELISKFCELGDEYLGTFIDFVQPKTSMNIRNSMILHEDSICVRKKGDLVIQFHKWIPESL